MAAEFGRARVSQEFEQALRARMTPRAFPSGTVLFRQGTEAAGIYLLEAGTVRVLLSTGENQNQLLELVSGGGILGLSEAVSGRNYRVTAEALDQTTAGFVDRKVFLSFLGERPEFCMQVVRLLSDNLHGLYHRFRNVSAHPGRPRRRSLNEQIN